MGFEAHHQSLDKPALLAYLRDEATSVRVRCWPHKDVTYDRKVGTVG